MAHYETIEVVQSELYATIWLNRPEIRNAFNEVMIRELTEAYKALDQEESVRYIVLRGRGKNFCAGADLNWMRSVAQYSKEQNLEESLNLSRCFHTIYSAAKPTIAVVHGAVIGGANGPMAASDFAIALDDTVFSLSEVKIGILPACVAPYVVKRVGEFPTKELMLSGKRFNGQEASRIGLVNHSFASMEEIDTYLEELGKQLKSSGPKAMARCKTLLYQLCNHWTLQQAHDKTAEMIADTRTSEEGQEGMAAFLEKRKPNWIA